MHGTLQGTVSTTRLASAPNQDEPTQVFPLMATNIPEVGAGGQQTSTQLLLF